MHSPLRSHARSELPVHTAFVRAALRQGEMLLPLVALASGICRSPPPHWCTIQCAPNLQPAASLSMMTATPSPPSPLSAAPARLPPLLRLSGLLSVFALHVGVLSRRSIPFWGQPLYLDSIAGGAALVALVLGRLRPATSSRRTVFAAPDPSLPAAAGPQPPARALPWADVKAGRVPLLETIGALAIAYWLSGYVAAALDVGLYSVEALGVTMSVAQHRAVQVFASHLIWVVMATRVLGTRLRPFFPPPFGNGRWLTVRWRSRWLGWSVVGYGASLAVYHLSDALSAVLLPPPPTDVIESSVVAKLVSPEGGDRWALAIGSLGPCLSAPVFEEVLYRGFLLPALTRFVPLAYALPLNAVLFGLHHNSLVALLPLSMLGLLWGWLYLLSGNLLVTILVHAMWNACVVQASSNTRRVRACPAKSNACAHR